MRLKTKLTLMVAVPVALALALPLLNLVLTPNNRGKLPAKLAGVPNWDRVADLLGHKCLSCHSAKPKLPFYASFPIAKSLVKKDITQGRAIFDAPEELHRKGTPPLSEAALAKLEVALKHNTMPPRRYLLLHWNHRLTAGEQALLLDWVGRVRTVFFTTAGTAPAYATGALQPLPASVREDARKVALGQEFFHDKRLSGDGTLSCASCHDLQKGGTDRRRVSTGIRGQHGGINSPTVFNAGFQFVQFWDGRAADLAAQAAGPVENPIEMGATWPSVVNKLMQDAKLVARMRAVYPDGVTAKNVQDAIAAFERTLVTPSRFDRYLRGEAKALTATEIRGYHAFQKHGCAMCHVGKVLGGQSYERMGLYKDYFQGRKLTDADQGRYNVTKRAYDRHRFKVPMLRNVAITAPYFHDGSTSDLRQAVQVMATHQLEPAVPAADVDAIVTFLRALTGTYRGKRLR